MWHVIVIAYSAPYYTIIAIFIIIKCNFAYTFTYIVLHTGSADGADDYKSLLLFHVRKLNVHTNAHRSITTPRIQDPVPRSTLHSSIKTYIVSALCDSCCRIFK